VDATRPTVAGRRGGEREPPGALRRRLARILQVLQERYPQVRVPLHHRDPFQLLVATVLSAQCTDAMVNRVTPALFARYPTPKDLADADPRELERLIRPTGFFRQKARALLAASRSLVERFGGVVPLRMDDLLTLEGVGRKTANVLLAAKRLEPWGSGDDPTDGMGIVVDTHVRRVSQRLRLVSADDPAQIEQELMARVPRAQWAALSLRLISFGREVCTARAPRCSACPLGKLCPAAPYRGAAPWMRRPRPRSRGRPAVRQRSR
jgi:endonuclease-3